MAQRRITLVRRNPDLTQAQFVEHWLTEHAALAQQLPGLRGYRINPVVRAPEGFAWDGLAELWFDSIEAADAAMASDPVGTTLKRDTRHLAAEVQPFFIEEHTIVPPPSDGGDDTSS